MGMLLRLRREGFGRIIREGLGLGLRVWVREEVKIYCAGK
jgi:hypothetical protein